MLARKLRRVVDHSKKRHPRPVGRASRVCVETLEQRMLLTAVVNHVFGAETTKQDDGDIMKSPPINIVFWGRYWQGGNGFDESQWNSNFSTDAQNIIDATSALIQSSYLNVTMQYGADPRNMFVNDTAWDSSTPPSGFDTGKLDDIVQNKIENGPFPEPEDQKGLHGENETPIYLVVTEPGVKAEQSDAAGYNIVPLDFYFPHFERTPEIWVSTSIDTSIPNNHVNISTFTKFLSHEIGEIMTDFNQGGYEVNTPSDWKGGGDDQIGDKEGNAYSFRMSDANGNPSNLVQPLWSRDDQAWVVTDGVAQIFNLQPLNWDTTDPTHPSFSGRYDLTINGDQWFDINDQITIGGTPSGGVVINLNGEIVNFDKNYLSTITLNLKSGSNSVTFLSDLPSDVRVNMNAASSFGGSIALHGSNTTVNSWQFSGADSGFYFSGGTSGTFADVDSIVGGTSGDGFQFFPGGSISGSIDGAGGSNLLDFTNFVDATHPDPVTVDLIAHTATPVGHSVLNITTVAGSSASDTLRAPGPFWTLSGANRGSAGTVAFSSIENLIGGSGDDFFNFLSAGVIAGVIDGGPGNNTFSYAQLSGPVFVSLSANLATSVHSFNNINKFVGNGNANNLISGPAGASVWNLTGFDSGTVNGISYASFPTLNGNVGDDRFVFQDGSFVSGLLAGGPGNNTLDYSATFGPVSVNFTTLRASNIGFEFLDINNVIGSQSANDTIVGPDAAWSITGTNTGSVNGIHFSSFENLTGGPLIDTYTFFPGGNISGNLDGGAGLNTLDYSHLTTPVTLDFGASTATGIGGTFANVGGFVGGQGANTVVGPSTATTWTVIGTNTVSAMGLTFNNFPSITGGAGNDTFAILTAGKLTGKIDGGGGTNTLTYAGFTGAVNVNLPLHTATNIGGGVANIQNVTAGNGNSLLVGDSSANVLTGGSGRNILIGESGADVLTGGMGENVLIGGSTAWDQNAAALSGIFAEWTRTDLSFEQRVSHLLSSGTAGLNGGYSLDKKSIFDDVSADVLVGSAGLDWFIESKQDLLAGGRTAGDHITTV